MRSLHQDPLVVYLTAKKIFFSSRINIQISINLSFLSYFFFLGCYIVQFILVGLNDQVSGKWFTANESVVSVEMPSGIAEAVGEGSTQGIGIKPFTLLKPPLAQI